MLKSLVAASAVAAASAGSLRQLQATSSPLPASPSTVTAVWSVHPTDVSLLDANITAHGTHFAHGVATLAGVDRTAVSFVGGARTCIANSEVFPCTAANSVYLVTVIQDGQYAPGRAHTLELAAEHEETVKGAFKMFPANVHIELSFVSARPNAWERDRNGKYNTDFGAYFGVGLAVCAVFMGIGLKDKLKGLFAGKKAEEAAAPPAVTASEEAPAAVPAKEEPAVVTAA